MTGRQKIWLAIAVTAVSCPMLCGRSAGMALGDKPMPDGHIGQEPWQYPLFLIFGASAVVSVVICASLIAALCKRGGQAFTMWLVRIAGLSPVGTGIALIVAGYLRVREGIYNEGIGALLLGLSLCAVGYALVFTKVEDFGGS